MARSPASLAPFSWHSMSNAVLGVRRRLLQAAGALARDGVPYAVVGGNAVAAWVARADEAAVRNTRDVDVLVRREDLPRATATLQRAGFRGGPAVRLFFAGERTRPDQLEPNADVQESEDTDVFRLISLEALVRMKLSDFREEDRVHLRDLVEVELVDAGGCRGSR